MPRALIGSLSYEGSSVPTWLPTASSEECPNIAAAAGL